MALWKLKKKVSHLLSEESVVLHTKFGPAVQAATVNTNILYERRALLIYFVFLLGMEELRNFISETIKDHEDTLDPDNPRDFIGKSQFYFTKLWNQSLPTNQTLSIEVNQLNLGF